MKTPKDVEYKIFPRIFALAEIVWLEAKKKDYKNFLERVRKFEKIFL